MYLPDQFEFRNPVKTCSGKRALEMLPVELSFVGAEKPMILCGKAGVQNGWLKHVTGAFRGNGIRLGIYDAVPRRFSPACLAELVGLYRDRDCDAIIAVGDGALLHTAKILNLVVSMHQQDLGKYDGGLAIQRPLKPLMAVLPCSGDGYEASDVACAGNRTLRSGYLMPDIAFIDPRIVRYFQPEKTVAAAMTALTHATEAFLHTHKNPMSDALAGACIRLVMENLIDAVSDEKAVQQRCALAAAFQMAASALANTGTGAVHLLAQKAAPLSSTSAGVLMGLLLPYALEAAAAAGENVDSLLLPMGGFGAFSARGGRLDTGQISAIATGLTSDLHKALPHCVPGSLGRAGLQGEMKAQIVKDLKKEDGVDINRCENIWDRAFAA